MKTTDERMNGRGRKCRC